jgi:hypothetical protein
LERAGITDADTSRASPRFPSPFLTECLTLQPFKGEQDISVLLPAQLSGETAGASGPLPQVY